jgi:DNA-binding NtrC family response regulator
MLVEHFLRQHSAEIGKTISGFEPAAMEALRRYPFPGNVRELSNIVERAAVLARTPTITLADLPPHVTDAEAARALWTGAAVPANPALNFPASAAPSPVPTAESSAPSASSLDDAMKEPERQIILAALKAAGGNKLKAAQALKINRTTLYKKLAALGIDPRAV